MERNLAVLIDFENIATGCDKEGLGRFDVRLVMRRLKDKGRILTARSYADWGRFHRFKSDQMHEGITMVELTSHGMQEKNRADIALAVDAMEIAYTRDYIDTFVVLSGDSDFTPLVMRLKELNKRVIGCGTRGSTSRLIAEVCDEFLYYDLLRHETRAETPAEDEGGLTSDEALELLVETLENHQRDEEQAPVHASILKAAMKRKQPTFNEVELGFRTFAKFLEAAQARNLVVLTPDARAGGVRVDLKNNDEPRKEPLRMSEGGMKVLQMLQSEGWDVGTAADRALVLDLLVGVCQERVRRNRKCAVQWVLGDLLRRMKQEKVHVPARVVRGIVAGLARAGALVHPDGEAVRSTSATFQAPDDAAPLRARLDAALLDVLRAKGLAGDDAALAEFFGATGTAGSGADDVHRGEDGAGDEESTRSGRRRGRRGGRRSSDRPAATEAGDAEAGDAEAAEPAVTVAAPEPVTPVEPAAQALEETDAEAVDAPARRRRRSRTPRPKTDEPTEG